MTDVQRVGGILLGAFCLAGLAAPAAIEAQAPPTAPAAFDVAKLTPLLTAHAEGVQVYECKPGPGGDLAWTFREPVATLIQGGRTIGRHYAGPTWELDDGGVVQGKVVKTAPGAAPEDIPLLELAVSERRGAGALTAASVVLRLATHGGALQGPCIAAGELRAQPYSADYVFLR